MSLAATAQVPGVAAWRARLRRARRAHHARSLGDVLTDLYMLLWLVVVYGGALVSVVRRHLQMSAVQVSAEPYWIAAAAILAAGGLLWQGLRALGPLLASPAEQAWALSTPMDRRGWLLPRFVALVLAGALAGALVLFVGAVAFHDHAVGWAALVGAVYGLAPAAATVTAQGVRPGRRWPGLVGAVTMGTGAAGTLLVVGVHYTGGQLPPLPLPFSPLAVLVGLPLAGAAIALALRTLPRLDRSRLGAGAQLAAAATTAAIGLDPRMLTAILEVRRWRRIGQVHSRPFLTTLRGRAWVLLQAELRRLARRPGSLIVWGALALAQYALAVVAPSVAGVARLFGAYLAAGRLAAGLRTVARSPGLRRSLGGDEKTIRLVHLVVPALGAVLWWAVTWPAAGPHLGTVELLLLAGIVAAAYRAATRPPLSYSGAVWETPFGLFPVELLLQLARGPDLLGAVIVLHVILAR